MNVCIDTNILLHLLRGSNLVTTIQENLSQLDPADSLIISIASVAEIESIAKQRDYGKRKQSHLKNILKQFLVIPIESLDLVDRYAEIDAYSLGKLASKPPTPRYSSRKMGKNDLWIAATASVTNAALLTTDKDFEHLDTVFINYVYIDPKQ